MTGRDGDPFRSITASGSSKIAFRKIARVGPQLNLYCTLELLNHERHTVFLPKTRGRHAFCWSIRNRFHLFLFLRHNKFNFNC